MYDFYGFERKEVNDNKQTLEDKLYRAVHENIRSRFVPYVQMYEFEGLIFCSPEAMETALNEPGVATWAQGVLNNFGGNPEAINDSVTTAPSNNSSFGVQI